MRIDGIGGIPPIVQQAGVAPSAAPSSAKSFMDYLQEALQDVTDMQNQAAALQDAFARGQFDNVHQVILAAQEAGIALDLILAVRNQAVRAYEEIMRMQV